MLPPYYRIEMFGGLCLIADGQVTVRFRSEAAESLLALLAYRPERRYRRTDLCRMLWPDIAPGAASAHLDAAIAALQHHLEPAPIAPGRVLRTEGDQVHLALDAFETDVAELRAALALTAPSQPEAVWRQALNRIMLLYTGELLIGLKDAWIVEERERWAIIHVAARHEWQKLSSPAIPSMPDPGPSTRFHAVVSQRQPRRDGITRRNILGSIAITGGLILTLIANRFTCLSPRRGKNQYY